MPKTKPATVAEYIQISPPIARKKLREMRSILKSVATALFLLSVASPGLAAFTDVAPGSDLAQTLEELQQAGVIDGYDDGSFRPDATINRAELVKILVKGALKTEPPDTLRDCFPDVRREWFASYVCYAKKRGWISGYPDGFFKPEQPVNHAETLKILLGSLFERHADFDSVSAMGCTRTEWYGPFLCVGVQTDVVRGREFKASSHALRGQTAQWLQRAMRAASAPIIDPVAPSN